MPRQNRGRPKTYIGARLRPDEYAALQARVVDEDTNVSDVLKRLLRDAGYLAAPTDPLPEGPTP